MIDIHVLNTYEVVFYEFHNAGKVAIAAVVDPLGLLLWLRDIQTWLFVPFFSVANLEIIHIKKMIVVTVIFLL